MRNIDEEINQALSQDNSGADADSELDLGLFGLLALTFHGKQAWITIYTWCIGFAAFIFGVYCAVQYFATADIKASLSWALGIVVSLFVLAIVKVIGWQQLVKHELLHAIRGLEQRLQAQSNYRQ